MSRLGLTQVPYSYFKELEAAGGGESSVEDDSLVAVGHVYPIYSDGWFKRRWASCKITHLRYGQGGCYYTFKISDTRFAQQLMDKPEPDPWYWTWFGMF